MKQCVILIKLFLLGILIFVFSCKENMTGVQGPLADIPKLSSIEFENIDVQLVDYNTVRITHKAGADLWSNDVCRIDIGTTEEGQFIRWSSYPADHDSLYPLYLIHFDFTVKMSEEDLVQNLTLRYIKTDSS